MHPSESGAGAAEDRMVPGQMLDNTLSYSTHILEAAGKASAVMTPLSRVMATVSCLRQCMRYLHMLAQLRNVVWNQSLGRCDAGKKVSPTHGTGAMKRCTLHRILLPRGFQERIAGDCWDRTYRSAISRTTVARLIRVNFRKV